MKDTFDKPPIRLEQEPSMGPPLIALGQRMPVTAKLPLDLPVWIPPLNRRLDTILRQQDEILYHLQHPWRVRFARWRAAIASLITRF